MNGRPFPKLKTNLKYLHNTIVTYIKLLSLFQVSRDLGKLYSEMIFVNGYVHCDPHPGNVLVNKTKEGTQIVLLDHGLYQVLIKEFYRL